MPRLLPTASLALAGLALSGLAGPATAQVALKLEGRCTRLVIAGQDLSAGCKPVLMNTVARNRTSFDFGGADGRTVSFSGNGYQQEATEETDPLQPVNLVIPGGADGPGGPTVAVGACRFTTPEPGKTQIACEASAAGSNAPEAAYAGTFVTEARSAPGSPGSPGR